MAGAAPQASTPGVAAQHPPRRAPSQAAADLRVNRHPPAVLRACFVALECGCALRAASCDAPGCAGGFDSDGARPAPLCMVEHRPQVVRGSARASRARREPIGLPAARRAQSSRWRWAHDGAAVHPREYSGRADDTQQQPMIGRSTPRIISIVIAATYHPFAERACERPSSGASLRAWKRRCQAIDLRPADRAAWSVPPGRPLLPRRPPCPRALLRVAL